MPDIGILDILLKNCNTVDTKTSSGQISSMQADEGSSTNKKPDAKALKCSANTYGITSINPNPVIIDNNNSKISYFNQGPSQETDRRASAKLIWHLQKECKDVFIGKVCFYDTCLLHIKGDIKPYQASPIYMVCTLQKPVKEDLEWLQQ